MLETLSDVTSRILHELSSIPGSSSRQGLDRRASAEMFVLQKIQQIDPSYAEELKQNQIDNNWSAEELLDVISDAGYDWLPDLSLPLAESFTDLKSAPDDLDDTLYTPFVDTLMDLDPDHDVFVLEREGNVHPKLLFVSWPRSLNTKLNEDLNTSIPFFIFIHPDLGQNMGSYYEARAQKGRESLKSIEDDSFYPYGWDYLYFIGINNLFDFNKRISYQVAASGKDVVTVIPILHETKGAGDILNPLKMSNILASIQAFQRSTLGLNTEDSDGSAVGPVAIGAFSAGHLHVNNLLSRIQANGTLFQEQFQELYMFDAPEGGVNTTWVALAQSWANKFGDDKTVRVYSQWVPSNAPQLLGKGQSIKTGKIRFNANNSNRSVGIFPSLSFRKVLELEASPTWQQVHQWIPKYFIADALRSSNNF